MADISQYSGFHSPIRKNQGYVPPKPYIFYTYHMEINPDDLHGHLMFFDGRRFDKLEQLLEQCEAYGWIPEQVLPPHYDGVIHVTRMYNNDMRKPSHVDRVVLKIHFKVKSIL